VPMDGEIKGSRESRTINRSLIDFRAQKTQLTVLMGSVLFYCICWIVFHRLLGSGVAFFVLLPVLTAAWCYGILGGVAAGFAGLVSNALFLYLFEESTADAYSTEPVRLVLGIIQIVGAGLVGYMSDLSRRLRRQATSLRRTEERLEQSEGRFRLMADLSPYPISIIDKEGRYLYLNDKFVETFGYALQDIPTGKEWFLKAYPKPEYREQAKNLWITDLKNTDQHEVRPREFTVTCKDGTVRDVIFKPVTMADGKQFVVYEDITERKEAEERLQYSTLYDSLTGLANRELLKVQLLHSLNRSRRNRDYLYAVLYLDLDAFKYVNDSYGHTVGDAFLVSTARKLISLTRPTDTVARLGGDEFAILLDDLKDIIEATIVAERIIYQFKAPFKIRGNEILSSVSIGIVPCSKGYDRVEDLLRDGDIALYRAKTGGKSRYEIFDVEMREDIERRLAMENNLRTALKQQDFSVHYQPIWSLTSGEPVGFEALIRWERGDEAVVSPGEFIPIAEEAGLIVPIDHWLIGRVCHQIHSWQKRFAGIEGFNFNLNLSSKDFSNQPDLVEVVETVLKATGINPRCLRFEITESAIMQNITAVVGIVAKLREMGIRFDLDDFGTGYSSLSYLHRFPVDGLKIDRSFTSRMTDDNKSLSIVKSIITVAHDLRLEVVSEGVETQEQLNILRDFGCDYVQGYLFSKPLDGKATEEFIGGFSSKTHASSCP
jgi:diguanylate cyclase (GGDEF)-like protein/PAS domain S-box-containing protein